ncbi:MAG: DUF87 domain-containing protein [Acidobacteria bacterium]|nr:DUF87 domain-containing protein [Acidobacteriota bacterium]
MADFFLGKESEEGKEGLVKPDSFATHAFILGMTGSGKTGLLISILEECALNDIPAVLIDPKGDLTNRLLVFKEVNKENISPFIPENKADEFISRYCNGLNEWNIGSEKVEQLLKRKVKVFTPGTSLFPVNILERFSSLSTQSEPDIIEKANSTTTSLLSLTKAKGDDAVNSPQGLLLSAVFIESWKKGEDLTPETLLEKVVDPPFSKLGALPLETVISKEKRISFAVELNGVLSSPLMTYFRKGEELNFDKIFSDPKNESIFTLSQLGDNQREFFLGIFLSELYQWVRRQKGSDRLKMALIFDEVFGFFPPYPQNPPTKQPLMGLLKQARAFGFSVILATQNPYDVDYKGLTNAGLWFIGRLQTQNDIDRVKEGLTSISGGDQTVSLLPQLKQREFVLNDVRKEKPIVFKTRQCISCLAGPLTESQLKTLLPQEATGQPVKVMRNVTIAPKDINILYGKGENLLPYFLFEAEIPYKLQKTMAWEKKKFYSKILEEGLEASLSSFDQFLEQNIDFSTSKPSDANISQLPVWISSTTKETIEREIKEAISLKCDLEIFKDPLTGLVSETNEPLEIFLSKVREERGKLKTQSKQKEIDNLLKKKKDKEMDLERSLIKLERLKSEYEKRKAETYTTAGVGILRGIFGSKRSILGGVSSTMTKERMAENAKSRYEEEKVANQKIKEELEEIERALQVITQKEQEQIDSSELEKIKILPFKSGIRILSLAIVYK